MSTIQLSDVEAVIFDAGNTLGLPDWPRIAELVRRLTGRSFAEDLLQRELVRVLSEADLDESFLQGLSARSIGFGWHFRALFSNLNFSDQEIETALGSLESAHRERHLWTRLNPEAPPVLDRLSQLGKRLAVISNSEDGQVGQLLGGMGIDHYFEAALDSYLFGTAKPDPRIFREAVEKLGVSPAEALYVGDMYTQDVVGARRAGLQGVLYDPMDLQPEREVPRIRSLLELIES